MDPHIWKRCGDTQHARMGTKRQCNVDAGGNQHSTGEMVACSNLGVARSRSPGLVSWTPRLLWPHSAHKGLLRCCNTTVKKLLQVARDRSWQLGRPLRRYRSERLRHLPHLHPSAAQHEWSGNRLCRRILNQPSEELVRNVLTPYVDGPAACVGAACLRRCRLLREATGRGDGI